MAEGSSANANLGMMQAIGSLMQAYGSYEAGRMARIEARRRNVMQQFQAEQAEIIAGREIAASQQSAAEQRRQAELVASRALAVAAASGAGVSDPTVIRLIAQTRGEGVYRANLALYEGEQRARRARLEAVGLRAEGATSIAEGDARATAYGRQGLGQLIKGAGSLYANYGGGGPSGDAALIGTYDYGHT